MSEDGDDANANGDKDDEWDCNPQTDYFFNKIKQENLLVLNTCLFFNKLYLTIRENIQVTINNNTISGKLQQL